MAIRVDEQLTARVRAPRRDVIAIFPAM